MWIDLVAAGSILCVGYILAVIFDAGDHLYAWMQTHEEWELDEIIVQAIILSFVLAIFLARRLGDLSKALRDKSRAELAAQELARHDPLTGLPNRRKFFAELRDRLSLDSTAPFAVFMIDLDRFKSVNDLYGHRTGDEVLLAVANRLTETVQDRGIVARLGGDEFAVLLYPSDNIVEACARLAQQLVSVLREPVLVNNVLAETGGSVGIAIYPEDGVTAEELVHSGDCAMYHSKNQGRGIHHFFQADMDRTLQERIVLGQELEAAIRDGQIVPYYQELVELPSRRLIGYEVLARWNHPTRGLIPPLTFIPIAEDSSKISKLTLALLRQVCVDAKAWRDNLIISINVSGRQLLEPGFAQQFIAVLITHGLSPKRVQIEITENDLIKRVEEVKVVLSLLRGQGMRIGLDDFGTGYSGLYHLLELPIDTVKVDRSFVTNMLSDTDKNRVVEAVLGLTHALGMSVTAEGVETREVSDRLTMMGCETAQGYLYGRPRPSEEIKADVGLAAVPKAAG
jgi:diguanylate cyclase (GGDEF)-like protein